jgi:hypothetical protein
MMRRKKTKNAKSLPAKKVTSAEEKKVRAGYRGRYQLKLDQAKELLSR